MGCSRKVAVARARELDIVVCRHARLRWAKAWCSEVGERVAAWTCRSLDGRDGQGEARSEAAGGRQTRGARSRRRANWACGEGRDSAARGRLAVCGVLVEGRGVKVRAWVVRKRAERFLRPVELLTASRVTSSVKCSLRSALYCHSITATQSPALHPTASLVACVFSPGNAPPSRHRPVQGLGHDALPKVPPARPLRLQNAKPRPRSGPTNPAPRAPSSCSTRTSSPSSPPRCQSDLVRKKGVADDILKKKELERGRGRKREQE